MLIKACQGFGFSEVHSHFYLKSKKKLLLDFEIKYLIALISWDTNYKDAMWVALKKCVAKTFFSIQWVCFSLKKYKFSCEEMLENLAMKVNIGLT